MSEGRVIHPLFDVADWANRVPGTSPFHVRGVTYCRMLQDASTLSGGLAAFRKGLTELGFDGFFAQPFRWTDWYDAVPLNAGTLVLARLSGLEPEMMARIGGEMTARHLVPRMFRILLGLGGVRAAVQHISWVLPWFYDFGEARLLGGTGRAIVVLLSDVPKVMAATYVNTIVGFMAGTADLIGVPQTTIAYSDVTMTGERDGFARLSMRCTITPAEARHTRTSQTTESRG